MTIVVDDVEDLGDGSVRVVYREQQYVFDFLGAAWVWVVREELVDDLGEIEYYRSKLTSC